MIVGGTWGGVAMSLHRDILNNALSDQEQASVPPWQEELSTQQKEWVRASIIGLQATTAVSDEQPGITVAGGSREQEDDHISQQRHPSHFGG